MKGQRFFHVKKRFILTCTDDFSCSSAIDFTAVVQHEVELSLICPVNSLVSFVMSVVSFSLRTFSIEINFNLQKNSWICNNEFYFDSCISCPMNLEWFEKPTSRRILICIGGSERLVGKEVVKENHSIERNLFIFLIRKMN